jgi:hypothetical protein
VEDGTWQIGGWIPSFGPLTETGVVIEGVSKNNIDFSVDDAGYRTITGSVTLDSLSGTGIAGTNVYAEPADGDYNKGGYAFVDDFGRYSLRLKDGNYRLRAFHPQYGEIGSFTGVTLSGSDITRSFVVPLPKTIEISFTGAGVP